MLLHRNPRITIFLNPQNYRMLFTIQLGAGQSRRDTYTLQERGEPYARQFVSEIAPLRTENTMPWKENAESAET